MSVTVGAQEQEEPLPTASVSLIGLSVAMITGAMPLTGSPPPALAGFSNSTVWLIVAAFFISSIAAGAPPLFAALALGFIGNLFGGLTHYASGPCGVIAGGGYVKIPEWFRVAFIMSIPVILIWTIIGGSWMYVTGVWN